MFISDLDYLNSIADSDPDSVVSGGFYHPYRLPLQHIFLFDREFRKGTFTGRSSGGYLTNDYGKTLGVFSFSKTGNKV